MKISECYIISEESHGAIGAAESPQAAAKWLIATGWIDEWTDYGVYVPSEHNPNKGEWVHIPICGHCKVNGIANWEQWFIDNASSEWLAEHFCISLYRMDYAVDE